MDFKRLIDKHSEPINVVDENKKLVNNRVVEGTPTKTTIQAAVFYLTPKDIKYYGGGNYTTQDIKFKTLSDLEEGTIIECRNARYKIDKKKDNTKHADFFQYVAVEQVVE